VALTLLLVTIAGGFARSLFNVKHIDLGLRTAHVLQFRRTATQWLRSGRELRLFPQLEDRISALPGVLSLSGTQEP